MRGEVWPALKDWVPSDKDKQDLIRAAKAGCVDTQRASKLNGQAGVTNEQIDAYCGCFADAIAPNLTSEELRYQAINGKPPANLQEKMDQIAKRCNSLTLGPAKNASEQGADRWPEAGINSVRTICYQQPRKDIPTASMDQYCTCYVALLQQNISWHDWLLVDLAVRTKGIQNLDAQEKSIMIRGLDDGAYCAQKIAPPG